MHRYYVEKIINSGDNDKLKELGEITIEAIDIVKDYSKIDYKALEDELYELIEGKKLNKEMADEWVANMKPAAKWTYEQIESVQKPYEIRPIDAYVLFNMLYSDMQEALGTGDTEDSIQRYINAVKGWYFDKDLKIDGAEKLYNYKKYIVK